MDRTLILIPAYNEERTLATVVAGLRQVLPEADLLVVDDGSRDRTAALGRELGATVVCHPWNMGYGTAIQTGYKYARVHDYACLVQLDGDGQHDPASIPGLLAPVLSGEADFALGSRFLQNGGYRPSWPRRLGMALFRRLVSLVVGQPISDSTSGFQAFNARVIDFLTGDFFPCDYPDADLLILLHRARFRIVERPVRMFPSATGQSMHGGLRPVYYVFKMCLSIGVTLLRSRRSLLQGEKP